MDIVKNYALKMLRESKENSPSKRKALKSESRIKRARKFRNEAAQDWHFNPSDEGLSGVPSYSPDRLVHLRDDLTPDDWNDIKNIEGMNAMIPNSVLEYGTDDSNLEGTFALTYSEGEYGFESYYGEDLDLMFYGYTETIDELKELVAKFVPYMADMTFEEIPFEDFVKRVSGMNSEDPEMTESADSESWRSQWRKGTGRSFGYDHNEPLLFMQTPDGKVSLTLGKDPYNGNGYVGEMDFDYAEDFVVETGDTIEEVLNKLKDYGAVENYFDLSMPSQDLLDYIESANEEDFNLEQPTEPVPVEDYDIDVQEMPEDMKMEGSKEYTFDIPCTATVVVTADSEDLAREILKRNDVLELAEDQIEFADGDGVLREVSFETANIDNLQAFDEFDPEGQPEPYFK